MLSRIQLASFSRIDEFVDQNDIPLTKYNLDCQREYEQDYNAKRQEYEEQKNNWNLEDESLKLNSNGAAGANASTAATAAATAAPTATATAITAAAAMTTTMNSAADTTVFNTALSSTVPKNLLKRSPPHLPADVSDTNEAKHDGQEGQGGFMDEGESSYWTHHDDPVPVPVPVPVHEDSVGLTYAHAHAHVVDTGIDTGINIDPEVAVMDEELEI